MKKLILVESTASEALCQIDAIENITPKNRDCLRLLTEEMFSMCMEFLDMETFDYELDKTAWLYSLRLSAQTQVNRKAKAQFMSVNNGKKAAEKGARGVLGSALEALFYGEHAKKPGKGMPENNMAAQGEDPLVAWRLSEYVKKTPKEQIAKEWDGMEKSILVNFADEVEISLRNGKIEITVYVKF